MVAWLGSAVTVAAAAPRAMHRPRPRPCRRHALRLRGELPRHRALIGIEPADMNWGTEPTEPVAAAVPEAAAAAQDLVRTWRAEAPAEVRT